MLDGGRMRRNQCAVFWLAGVVNFGVSASVATMAPFFPQEAARRGLTTTTAALVFCVYSLSALVTSPFMTRLVPLVGPRNVFLAGCFLVGIGNIAFGSLVYVQESWPFKIYCFIVRILMGMGSAANFTAILTYISSTFPDNIAVTVGMMEAFTALGTCAGPALGGLLFTAGGYSVPFYSVGAFLLLLLPVNACAMPPVEGVTTKTKPQYGRFLAYWPVYIVLGSVAMATMLIGFSEVILAQHLHKRFGLEPNIIGLVFLLFAVSYGVASPIAGRVSDVMKHKLLLIGFAQLLTPVALICFAPPPLITFIPTDVLWLALLSMCLAIALTATAMVPTFGILRDMMQGPLGFPDDVTTDALLSSAFQTFFYIGYIVGPALGGPLVDAMGSNNATSIMGGVVFLWGVLTLTLAGVLACRGPGQHGPLSQSEEGCAPSPGGSPPPPPPAAAKPRPSNLDLSQLSARDSGGYRSFLPDVGSLSPPPERAELRPDLAELPSPADDGERRIAEMIKNADLSELQELLKSPLDTPPLPW